MPINNDKKKQYIINFLFPKTKRKFPEKSEMSKPQSAPYIISI